MGMSQARHEPRDYKLSVSLNKVSAHGFNLQGRHEGVQDAPINRFSLQYNDAPGSVVVTIARLFGAPENVFPPLAPTERAFKKALEAEFGSAHVKTLDVPRDSKGFVTHIEVEHEHDMNRVLGAVAHILPPSVVSDIRYALPEAALPERPKRSWPSVVLRSTRSVQSSTSGREQPIVYDLEQVVNETVQRLIKDTDKVLLERGTRPSPFGAKLFHARTGVGMGCDFPADSALVKDAVMSLDVPTAVPTAAVMDALSPYFRAEGVSRKGERLDIPMTNFIPRQREAHK